MPRIFINYRDEDSRGYAGRLYDALKAEFPPRDIFRDKVNLAIGLDFDRQIEESLGTCDVLLALIGDRWTEILERRLDNPQSDYMRREIAAALDRDIPVVPILIDRVTMPDESKLPDDIAGLCRRHAFELSDSRWDYDISILIDSLRRIDATEDEEGGSVVPPDSPGVQASVHEELDGMKPEGEEVGDASPRRVSEALVTGAVAAPSPDRERLLEAEDPDPGSIGWRAGVRPLSWPSPTGVGPRVNDVAFSPDGRYLAIASQGRSAYVIEASSGAEIAEVKHRKKVRSIAVSPDGLFVATASADCTARITEIESGQEVASWAHTKGVNAVAFSSDGQLLATGADTFARILDVASESEVICIDHGRWLSGVNDITFSPDGLFFATACDNRLVRVMSLSTSMEVLRVEHPRRVHSVAFSPDGRFLATACQDGCVRITDVRGGASWESPELFAPTRTVAFSPDGELLAVGGAKGLHILEVPEAGEVVFHEITGRVESLAFSPDGLLAVGLPFHGAVLFGPAT